MKLIRLTVDYIEQQPEEGKHKERYTVVIGDNTSHHFLECEKDGFIELLRSCTKKKQIEKRSTTAPNPFTFRVNFEMFQ